MEKYSNNGSNIVLKNTNHVSELKNIIIEDDNVFFVVSAPSGDGRVLLFNDTSFIIIDDLSRDELSINNINSELAKNFMNDIATLIIRDFGNVRNIEENIKILSKDEEGIKFLFRDERLEFEFIILFGNENISIFNPENGEEIITSEYTLDIARIAMMNIFLSSFISDVPHIFYNHFGNEDYPKKDIDLATPIFKSVDYNLVADDFTTYFNRLKGIINKSNIIDLTRQFIKSGWAKAVKFILENTPENVIRSSNDDNIMSIDNNVVFKIISYMVQSNDQEMFDFIFDEFMPKYGYDNETNYIDLAFLIIIYGTLEEFKYLVYKSPNDFDLTKEEDTFFNYDLFHFAIIRNTDIAKYMIFNYDIDPNEKVEQNSTKKSYIRLSIENDNIEIFKLLINKNGLVLSEEDRKLIESKAKFDEEIRTVYEEYLEKNIYKITTSVGFDQDEEQFPWHI